MHAFTNPNKTEKSNVEVSKKMQSLTTAPITLPKPTTPIITKQLPDKLSTVSESPSGESKKVCLIPSERLFQLKKHVDDAIREKKTFTIKGGWQTIRNQFLQRGWVEKYEASYNAKNKPSAPKDADDITSNLPIKLDWESQPAYVQKCEKTIMSRMMANHAVDFYWNMRREPGDWNHRVASHQIMNRFYRSLFTSKEGLNLLLQNSHWYCEPGVSVVTFPRCYTLGFPDHHDNFISDFRITACMCLLKWLVHKYENEDEYSIKSPDGKVPHTAIQFALDRCNDYIACQKHFDIDREFVKIWNHEWDAFLSNFSLIVHQNALFLDSNQWTLPLFNAAARTTLAEMRKYWPMIDADGMKNIWILKPGNKCRGRGIQLIRNLEDVQKVVSLKLKYVVQKYIEKPLLIYQTKFDIRQWFMVTSVQPLNIWMYRECYLRFSGQIFNLENFHESLHLTNHAVQCKYSNVTHRDKALPEHNMWDSKTFQNYLKDIGQGEKWDSVIYPGMRENIVGSMISCQDSMDRRVNTFELYGADFILSDDFVPWLLEINSSPDLSPSTKITSRLCPQCLQDLVKVVVDKRRNPSADTGNFDLVYKQLLPRPPAYLGMSLSVRGRRIFKSKRSKEKNQKDKENSETQQTNVFGLTKPDIVTRVMPKILASDLYKGPIIGDLIEEIQHTLYPKTEGYEFIPVDPPASAPTKKKSDKHNRVSNRLCRSHKTQFTKQNFINRKQNDALGESSSSKLKETSPQKLPSKLFIRNSYFGLINEWKLTGKLNSGNDSETKHGKMWENNAKGMPNVIDRKSSVQNLSSINGNLNKKQIQIPYCVSSVNLNLAFPHVSQLHFSALENLSAKSAFERNNILPSKNKNK